VLRGRGETYIYIYRILVGKLEGKTERERDWRIILRWIFWKWVGVQTGSSWLKMGTGGGQL